MRVVLIGGAGHASDVLGVFESRATLMGDRSAIIVGIVADFEIDEGRFAHRGVRQIGAIDDLKTIDASHYVICVGYSGGRRDVEARVRDFGLKAATVVHPHVSIPSSVSIGEGSVVLQCCISPMAVLGRHVYISHGALIGHDAILQDFVTVLPGASVSGDTVLGEASLIGANATVLEKITIGHDAIVGAGAVVLRDVAPGVTVVGNPARVVVPK